MSADSAPKNPARVRGGRHAAAVARRRRTVTTADLRLAKLSGDVPERLRPYIPAAQDVGIELTAALGGAERITPQRKLLIEDAMRCEVIVNVAMLRFLQSDGTDDDAARLALNATGTRQRALKLLGLDRVAKEIDLRGYLAEGGK